MLLYATSIVLHSGVRGTLSVTLMQLGCIEQREVRLLRSQLFDLRVGFQVVQSVKCSS